MLRQGGRTLRVLLTGGGTGGHIYPALAVAEELKRIDPGVEILYVGTARGLEADIVPRAGLPFRVVSSAGLLGKSPLRVLTGLARAGKGFWEAMAILGEFRPQVVLGTGGYVSGPVVLAALFRRIPSFLQEQNVFPGFTNRVLSRYVAGVFVPFAEARRHFPATARLFITGNPVRRQVLERGRGEAQRALGLSPQRKTVYIVGGSRGAKRVVQAALTILPELARRPDVQVLFSTGAEYFPEVAEKWGEGAAPNKVICRPFFYDAENALAAADVVVGRAGAMTIAEITARGLPAVLIPSPNVANDHQTKNAALLAEKGAALVLPEAELSGPRLLDALSALLDQPDRYHKMAEQSRKMGRPDAAATIARRLLEAARR